jgi:hypothetical protein
MKIISILGNDLWLFYCVTVKKGKAIPVTGHGGPIGLTDGGKVVSLMCRPPFTPKNIPRIFLVLISVRG